MVATFANKVLFSPLQGKRYISSSEEEEPENSSEGEESLSEDEISDEAASEDEGSPSSSVLRDPDWLPSDYEDDDEGGAGGGHAATQNRSAPRAQAEAATARQDVRAGPSTALVPAPAISLPPINDLPIYKKALRSKCVFPVNTRHPVKRALVIGCTYKYRWENNLSAVCLFVYIYTYMGYALCAYMGYALCAYTWTRMHEPAFFFIYFSAHSLTASPSRHCVQR